MTTELREDSLVRDEILYLPVDVIDPDPEQPRLQVDAELADSIAQHGVLQPIQVRPSPNDADRFFIVDGERRWKGAVAAKVKTIPAQITLEVEDVGDRLVRQIVRNEGKPLTPVEEAKAFKRIIEERQAAGQKTYGVVQLAKELGKSKSTVSDRVALAEAPAPFVKLFDKGEISIAAAPVVRQYAEVPDKILENAIKQMREDFDWSDAVEMGRPVPLDELKRLLEWYILDDSNGGLVGLEGALAQRYQGEGAQTVTVKGKRYAIDVAKARRIEGEIEAERLAKAKKGGKAGSDTGYQESAADKRYAREAAERRRKEAQATKKKVDLRRAQFAAIAAALPPALDEGWSLFAVTWLLEEMHNDARRVACKLLGLEALKKKASYGGTQTYFDKPIVAHAESLDLAGRTRLLLQLLLVHDANPGSYDMSAAKRLKAAAELLGLDLATIKPGEAPVNPIAKSRPPSCEVLSEFSTRTLNKSMLKKPIDQWPNEKVRYALDFANLQLTKYDDPAIGTEPLNGTREQVFLAGATRDQVISDIAVLTHAAQVRGLIGSPDPADEDEDDGDLGDAMDEQYEDLWDGEDAENEPEPAHAGAED